MPTKTIIVFRIVMRLSRKWPVYHPFAKSWILTFPGLGLFHYLRVVKLVITFSELVIIQQNVNYLI
jgi:hypothetical protein